MGAYSRQLEADLRDSGCALIAENTFLSVEDLTGDGKARPASAPCSRLASPVRSRHHTSSDPRVVEEATPPSTPELWPRWDASESEVHPAIDLPAGARALTTTTPRHAPLTHSSHVES